jgi:signal transduction histidine kinase/HPt (histidine-containing phosphotransfer) domain-containing protein/ActR/RegA family two-component response regulator
MVVHTSDHADDELPLGAVSGVPAEDAERYLLALAAINLSVYDWNIETGRIEHPLLGQEVRRRWVEQPLTAEAWERAVHPDDRGGLRAALRAHFKKETTRLDCEYRYLSSGGTWRWARQYGIALRRADGRAYRLVGATADVTEIRQGELDLQAARAETEWTREHMQALLDNMRDGVGSAMADGSYLMSNKAMFGQVDIPRDTIVALGTMQNIWRYQYEHALVPRIAANADEHVAAQLALFDRADGSQQVRQRPDGSWVERSFRRMPDGSRLVVVRDITELKSREREIARERDAAEAARAEAEAANQAKSTFLAIMSHEIRTPMNGVLGLLELLEHQGISESQRAIVATMRSSASALLRIVDDVLDFSRIEAGRLELEEAPFLLSELVGGTVDALRPQAMAKGLALSAELVPGSADALIGDALRVRQILFNLLGNALKFTNEGSVHVRAATSPLGEGEYRVTLNVTDTGIGISEAERARLFRPFSQGDSSTTRRFGGSGLGLSIVRRLAQLMHGDVRVRNLPGKGSAFTVTLRLHAAGADDVVPVVATPQGLAALDASGGRVLVADDHPVNRQVLQGQLALLGLAVDTATDGMHALSLWQPGRYAVVLADMHMPRLDGYGLTAEIRAREAASRVSRTPIVAVTANATRGEEEHCLAGGMDAYLAKPVTLEGLGATLGRWITVTLPDEPLTPSVDRGLLRNWLGDDEAAVRSLLAEFLANARDNARDVETALSEGDMSALTFAVHKLKGGALSIGAHELQRLAAALEVAARRGDDAACRHMLGTLAHALERTAADIGA